MTDQDTGGKAADSPTAEATDQATVTDQTTDTGTSDPTDQTGQTPADSQAADTGVSDGEKDKPPPYDQDPKWKSARAAERRVNEILEAHGYDDIDSLVTDLESGHSLKALLGNRDAKELVAEYDEFQRVKEYWAEQRAAKQEAEETPEETAERYKREKQELEDRYNREKADREAQKENQRLLNSFDDGIRTYAKSLDDVHQDDRQFLIEFLGVDNEMTTVSVSDQAAIKRTREAARKRFTNFVKSVEQRAIDNYVKGQSDITPMSASDSTTVDSDSVKTEPDKLDPNMTMDDANTMAKAEISEILKKAFNAP